MNNSVTQTVGCVDLFATKRTNLAVRSVVVNEDEDTPLLLECSRGQLDWVKALINKHVNPRGL